MNEIGCSSCNDKGRCMIAHVNKNVLVDKDGNCKQDLACKGYFDDTIMFDMEDDLDEND
jgi:hypothetical protein